MATPLLAKNQFLSYVNQTGSPYHSVHVVKQLLLRNAFEEIKESQAPWTLRRGGKYFLTKHGASICAFVVGGNFDGGQGSR